MTRHRAGGQPLNPEKVIELVTIALDRLGVRTPEDLERLLREKDATKAAAEGVADPL